ncbi:TetR/AcrR family transcriptional regulator [Marinactinospora rubrisoli]|uniref:TetR/AcrR family transcriptional regulator n=1 Tax=Marinactinospora rubrisoli TaxID=2715399 RepID=A0ABW2KKZ5_9ACTN
MSLSDSSHKRRATFASRVLAERLAGAGAPLIPREHSLRTRGVGRLSLRDLAREVGVSHAAPRRHFPERRDLLDALAEAGFRRLGESIRHAINGLATLVNTGLIDGGRLDELTDTAVNQFLKGAAP